MMPGKRSVRSANKPHDQLQLQPSSPSADSQFSAAHTQLVHVQVRVSNGVYCASKDLLVYTLSWKVGMWGLARARGGGVLARKKVVHEVDLTIDSPKIAGVDQNDSHGILRYM